MENVMSSAESRLKPNHKIELSHTAGVLQPAGSESKQGPNTRTAAQAVYLLAAEKPPGRGPNPSVAPASCRLSRGRLALGSASGTPPGQPPGRRRYGELVLSKLQFKFVNVTPTPILPGLDRSHDGMLGRVEVFRSMFILGRIATPDVPTAQTQAKVTPRTAHFKTF